jgi:hypothetical protein
MASLTSIAAEFQESIKTFIPQILSLLTGTNRDVRAAGAAALSKLSEHGM